MTIITQPDHARLAGEILSLWRADGLPQHPRRQEILFATREHDNGWQETDSAPLTDPERHRPYDFFSLPEPDRVEIWQRGIHRFASQKPFVALLLAQHAETIHRPGSDLWTQFFDVLAPERQQWQERAGIEPDNVLLDYAFLNLADALSLAICTRGRVPVHHPEIRVEVVGDLLRVTPFPLAGTTTFKIPLRRIENRPYHSDTDIGGALARARWRYWEFKIGPGTPRNA